MRRTIFAGKLRGILHPKTFRGRGRVTITVVSPHRDDAAFSVGLAIGTWQEMGHSVEVVNCFTRSEYSPFGDLTFVEANDLRSYVSAMRHQEDVRWSRRYRRPVALVDLNLRDAPQRLQCSVDEVCGYPVNPEDPAIEKIRSGLKKRVTGALVLPLAVGEHVDHMTARLAAQDGWPASLPIAFYEDLPYAARLGAAEGIELLAGSLPGGLESWFASEATEIPAAVEKKRQMALCYDSQIDSEVTGQIANFCVRYAGRERLWVNEAWRGASLGVSR